MYKVLVIMLQLCYNNTVSMIGGRLTWINLRKILLVY